MGLAVVATSAENMVDVIVNVAVMGAGHNIHIVGVVAKPCVIAASWSYVAAVPYLIAPLNVAPFRLKLVAVRFVELTMVAVVFVIVAVLRYTTAPLCASKDDPLL